MDPIWVTQHPEGREEWIASLSLGDPQEAARIRQAFARTTRPVICRSHFSDSQFFLNSRGQKELIGGERPTPQVLF